MQSAGTVTLDFILFGVIPLWTTRVRFVTSKPFEIFMSPTKGEGDILVSVRIPLVSASVSALA